MSKKVRNLKILWTCQLCLVESQNARGVLIKTLSRSQSRKISMLMEWGGDDSGLLTSGISADYQAKLNLWRLLIKLRLRLVRLVHWPGWPWLMSCQTRSPSPLQTIFLFTPCFYNLANIPSSSSIMTKRLAATERHFPQDDGTENQSERFIWLARRRNYLR